MKKYLVSVIIPTFNAEVFINQALQSLLDQTYPVDEIIVIDNKSTDKTIKKIKQKISNKIILYCLNKNTGVTGGRNHGIKKMSRKSDFVLFFDQDMIAKKNMLEELIKTIDSQESIGIVTPKIYYLSNKKLIWSAGTNINLYTGQILFRGGYDNGHFDQDQEVRVAPAVFLVKRQVLKKITQFDVRYFATYEDTDFCFRAYQAGFKTFYSAHSLAYHDHPIDKNLESNRLLNRLYWVGRNRVLFMKDFGKNFGVFLLFLPIFAIYYLRLALKYGSIKNWFSFIRGMSDGLRSL